jgi:hypothetical protein
VGFEAAARPRPRITYRKQIAEKALDAIFAVAHCPGLPWIRERNRKDKVRIGDDAEEAMDNFLITAIHSR